MSVGVAGLEGDSPAVEQLCSRGVSLERAEVVECTRISRPPSAPIEFNLKRSACLAAHLCISITRLNPRLNVFVSLTAYVYITHLNASECILVKTPCMRARGTRTLEGQINALRASRHTNTLHRLILGQTLCTSRHTYTLYRRILG